jgi:hypothetical protein
MTKSPGQNLIIKRGRSGARLPDSIHRRCKGLLRSFDANCFNAFALGLGTLVETVEINVSQVGVSEATAVKAPACPQRFNCYSAIGLSRVLGREFLSPRDSS